MRRCMRHFGLSGAALGVADEVQIEHAVEDVVAAFLRAIGIRQRIAAGRELRDRCERCGFSQCELVELLAVVILGASGDAVRAIAEEALVEVQLEDLVLGQFTLDFQRKRDLGQLPGVAVFVAEEVLLDNLLGNRAAARNAVSVGCREQPDCARDAAPVHSGMLVEPGVLDREERAFEAHGDVLDADRVASDLAKLRNQPPFTRIDVHWQLQFDVPQALDVGQAWHQQPIGNPQRRHAKNKQNKACVDRAAQPAEESGHPWELPEVYRG